MRASRLVRENMRPDPPGAAAERIAYRAAFERAWPEAVARFGTLSTAATALEMLEWLDTRIADLLRADRGAR